MCVYKRIDIKQESQQRNGVNHQQFYKQSVQKLSLKKTKHHPLTNNSYTNGVLLQGKIRVWSISKQKA